MRRVFSIDGWGRDGVLLFTRVGIAALMLVHGLPKLQKLLSAEPVKFVDVWGMGAGWTLGLAVFSEVLCSLLILIGLATRLAVIPLILTMLVAVFYVHADDPFVKQELGLLYMLVYVGLLFHGSGKYSADHAIARRET